MGRLLSFAVSGCQTTGDISGPMSHNSLLAELELESGSLPITEVEI